MYLSNGVIWTLRGVVLWGARGAILAMAAPPPQILADQLTLSQPGGTDHAHLNTTGTPGFSDFPTALTLFYSQSKYPLLH